MGFNKASELAPDGTVYCSEEMREALELCEKQRKMIEEMKEELDNMIEEYE